MNDEHELHDEHELPEGDADLSEDIDSGGLLDEQIAAENENYLVSAEKFDDELARLEPDVPDEASASQAAEAYAEAGTEDDHLEAMDEERLRGPRAQTFRRRLRDQVSMLPLALWLLAVGAFLLAREQRVSGLPNFSTLALVEMSVLAVAATKVVHSLLSGRRERGLLFLGLWIWVTAAMLAALVYGIDDQPDVRQWWPIGLWSLGVTLLLTYMLERTHDTRLILLSTVVLVGGVTAYAVTSDRISQSILDQAADYWPLLFTVLGVVLLPLAFRRRA